MSRASRRSRRPTSRPPTSSATASSCSASRCDTGKGIEQRVHPTMVPKDSAIAQVMGVTNAVDGRCRCGRSRSRWSAPAPAAWRPRRRWSPTSPTSRAACARRRSAGRRRGSTAAGKAPMQRHEGGYYIRLLARDRPGTAATIAHAAGRAGHFARIDRAAPSGPRPQGGDDPDKTAAPVPVILITYATTEDAVRRALAAVRRDRVISRRAAGHPHREELSRAGSACAECRQRERVDVDDYRPGRTRCSSASSRSRSCA